MTAPAPLRKTFDEIIGLGQLGKQFDDAASVANSTGSITAYLRAMRDTLAMMLVVLTNRAPATGNVFLYGHGVPNDALGNNGDLYLDIDTANLYAKENSTWL